MIISRKYSGDKRIEGNYSSIDVEGRTKRSILNDALVLDIVTFDYTRQGIPSIGEDHDYRPQLLILGSNSMKYSGAKRMPDRITGVNLHYLSQGQASTLINSTKNKFAQRISNPKSITESLMKVKSNPVNYRQYLIKNITKFYSLYSLMSLENVQDELSEEGSIQDYRKEKNERVILKVNKNEKIRNVETSFLEDLGFEPDIYS